MILDCLLIQLVQFEQINYCVPNPKFPNHFPNSFKGQTVFPVIGPEDHMVFLKEPTAMYI